MTSKQEFFSNNFSSFVLDNKNFFIKYKPHFIKLFQEYIIKLTRSNLQIDNKEIETFYDNLFISPLFLKNKVIPSKELNLIYKLNDYDVDSVYVLNKVFLILSNNYIKHLIKEKNSIKKLKTLTFLLDFYINYIELHKDIEDDNTQIPQEIKEIYFNKKQLNLFTIYKGIPIAHKTHILSIDEKEGVIKVSANNYQIVAAKFHKEIFLLENDKEYSFRANIKHFVVHKKVMYLDNIEKIQRNAPKRSFIRVQPKNKIDVELQCEDIILNTELYDISLRGMCVIGKKSNLKVSDIVKSEFILKLEKPYLFVTQGEIKSITKLDSEKYRYHIHFELPTHYEYILSKYITKREKEIIKELNAYISKEFIALSE
ncbi:type IV pilus assembly protein PilZ [Nautilia profundicola AmH]|uniref:Type IV pilus assembly protein PilZ n=1 Tax=Nautilia profundicola (strain ATCC BAA-1463 / DSM 18972 / AmH) TaxID=598659 RepID=B9L8E2_NAUPA|nr:PilZ domain-containing protein [Nautilia profundicola]ACM92362.1 type IV pilus assembly protein PilZ [Nautilia profundicola AmH]